MTSAACRSCALPLPGDSSLCLDCLGDPLPVDWSVAWGHYRGGLEHVLRALKFRRHDFLAGPLGGLLRERLPDADFDAVVPVPMHRRKLRRRGYNQAELLARALAKGMAVPCQPRFLSRPEERATQSKLNRLDRRANVRGAFAASPDVAGRRVLLVDDVCTTGETVRACAGELVKKGAARVCAVVVAKSG